MIFLGIDSGTQSTKTVALDADTGEIVASAQKFYGMVEGLPPGHLEQEPRWWVDALRETLAACLNSLGGRIQEVHGIGVSGQQHGLVPLDAKGEPVRPAKLWCDTSTQPQCAEIEAALGGAKGLIELAGLPMLPGYTAPKILWFKQNEPDRFARTRTFLLPHDYLNYFLTGETTMEYGDASGTALLDVRKREWCRKITDFLDPRLVKMLPPLRSSAAPAGLLRQELCDEWGLKSPTVVSAGGGDNMMGAIGTGNIAAGRVTASFGTSGTLYAFSESPVVDPRGEVAAFCDSTDHWLPLVCTMNVTVATEQVRALFGWSLDELDRAVAEAPAGADGVLFLPFLNGERTPNLPDGKALFHGLTPRNMTAPNLARAAMEGATLGLAYGLRRLRELGVEPQEIRLTGGGSKSAVWRQLASDVFGVPTVCLSVSEGAALGAALQAAWAFSATEGEPQSLDSLCARAVKPDEATRCTPDPDRQALYAGLLEKHVGLTGCLHTAGHL